MTEGDGTVEVCLRIDRNCIGDFEVLIKTRDGSNNQTAAKGAYFINQYLIRVLLYCLIKYICVKLKK